MYKYDGMRSIFLQTLTIFSKDVSRWSSAQYGVQTPLRNDLADQHQMREMRENPVDPYPEPLSFLAESDDDVLSSGSESVPSIADDNDSRDLQSQIAKPAEDDVFDVQVSSSTNQVRSEVTGQIQRQPITAFTQCAFLMDMLRATSTKCSVAY